MWAGLRDGAGCGAGPREGRGLQVDAGAQPSLGAVGFTGVGPPPPSGPSSPAPYAPIVNEQKWFGCFGLSGYVGLILFVSNELL